MYLALRPEIRAELLSPPRTNLSVTPTSFNRMYSDTEVESQTLKGSEPNIDHTFEGGNMKLSLLPFDNVLEVGAKTCMVPNLALIIPMGGKIRDHCLLWVYKTELLKFIIIHSMDQIQTLIMMKEGLVNFWKVLD